MSKITVKSVSRRGRWRSGIHFTREGVELDTAELSKAQLLAIQGDPKLVVIEPQETAAERKAREAAEKAAAEKAAAEKAAAEKAAAEKAAAEKAAAEKTGKGKGGK